MLWKIRSSDPSKDYTCLLHMPWLKKLMVFGLEAVASSPIERILMKRLDDWMIPNQLHTSTFQGVSIFTLKDGELTPFRNHLKHVLAGAGMINSWSIMGVFQLDRTVSFVVFFSHFS